MKKILSKLNSFFNEKCAWFFTNGNKTPQVSFPKVNKVEVIDGNKIYFIKNVEHLEFSLSDDLTVFKIKVVKNVQ